MDIINVLISKVMDIFASNLWQVFAVFSILLSAFEIIRINIINAKKEKVIVMEKPFENELSNELYAMSFAKPFSETVITDNRHPKVKDIEELIAEAQMTHLLNYRVFSVIQTGLLIGGFIILFLLVIASKELSAIFSWMFNIKASNEPTSPIASFGIGIIIIMGLFLAPKLYLSQKADKNKFLFFKDLPILQLFIILTLRAKRPVNELLYVLSKTETSYKEIFASAYRVYARDKEEAFETLKRAFAGTRMSDTITVLSEFNEYSRDESILLLENNLEEIINEVNNVKRRKDITGNVLSQGSLIFPLASVLLLGLIPIAMYGMDVLSTATETSEEEIMEI